MYIAVGGLFLVLSILPGLALSLSKAWLYLFSLEAWLYLFSLEAWLYLFSLEAWLYLLSLVAWLYLSSLSCSVCSYASRIAVRLSVCLSGDAKAGRCACEHARVQAGKADGGATLRLRGR